MIKMGKLGSNLKMYIEVIKYLLQTDKFSKRKLAYSANNYFEHIKCVKDPIEYSDLSM